MVQLGIVEQWVMYSFVKKYYYTESEKWEFTFVVYFKIGAWIHVTKGITLIIVLLLL